MIFSTVMWTFIRGVIPHIPNASSVEDLRFQAAQTLPHHRSVLCEALRAARLGRWTVTVQRGWSWDGAWRLGKDEEVVVLYRLKSSNSGSPHAFFFSFRIQARVAMEDSYGPLSSADWWFQSRFFHVFRPWKCGESPCHVLEWVAEPSTRWWTSILFGGARVTLCMIILW